MKFLILTCATGGGHNATAAALQACIEAGGDQCRIIGALDFFPPRAARLISKGHDFAYKFAPKIYGVGYRFEEKHPKEMAYDQDTVSASLLCQALQAEQADVVLCVHVFAAMMMTELRLRRAVTVPTFFIATDYTCSPGVASIDADGFFIPHPALRDEFAAAGVPSHKLIAAGIPVSAAFSPAQDKAALRQALGLADCNRLVLLAGGSMGCGPIPQIALTVSQKLGQEDRLLVICGNNRSLYRCLRSLLRRDPRVQVRGYEKNMPACICAADLMITKAGGLSTTEAVAAGVPLLYINAVPGCESRNIAFMTKNGYAAAADTARHIAPMAAAMLADTDGITAMVQRRNDFPAASAQRIYETAAEFARSAACLP